MTREQKLALIVGFSLILLVGVLISDHLSRARAIQVANIDAEEPGVAPGSGPNLPDAVHRAVLTHASPAQMPPTIAAAPPPAPAPVYGEPESPGLIPMGPVTAGHQFASNVFESPAAGGLGDNAQRLLNDLRNGMQNSGVAEVHPFVGVEPVIAEPLLVGPAPEPPARPATIWYTVKQKDTLYQIALRHYGDPKAWRQIVELNKGRVAPDGAVRAGIRIELYEKLPGGPILTPVAPPAGKPKATPRPAFNDQRVAKADPPVKPDQPTAPRTYKVQKGDSLGVISQRLLGTVRRTHEILDLNRAIVEDEDSIRVGMVLKMPPR